MIEVKNFHKIFNPNKVNSFHALKNINLSVQKNELIILKGVSGSGKSTLLMAIASFIKPSSGSVEVLGENIVKLPDSHISQFRSKHIGFVFQSFNLFEQLSVAQNILTPLIPLGVSMEQADSLIDDILEKTDIAHKKNEIVKNLSGGEKQRTAIARALINNPEIILCDEPTAALDQQNSITFIKILQELQKDGKTIIVATHDPLFDTLDFPCRVIQIENGCIISE
jgi:putative ABC transport system ATP-binding protein